MNGLFDNPVLLILIIGIIAAIVFFVVIPKVKNKSKDKDSDKDGIPDIQGTDSPVFEGDVLGLVIKGVPKAWKFNHVTPNGVKIRCTKEILPQFQENVFLCVEYGVTNNIVAAKFHHPEWDKMMTLSNYDIGFIDPHINNQDGSPALLHSGKYQTAGTVIGIGYDNYPIPMLIVPHQVDSNWKFLLYLEESIWNEGEHRIEYANLPKEQAAQYAGLGDIHQHRSLPEGTVRLTINTAKGFINRLVPKCISPSSENSK